MLQRIQTIFLFIAAVAMAVFIFSPIWLAAGANQEFIKMTSFELLRSKADVVSSTPTFYLAILAGFSIILAFVSMFSYKNRPLQLRLNAFNSLLVAIITGIIVYFTYKLPSEVDTIVSNQPALGFFMLVVTIVFNRLASFFIRKDERMVRSADRLRD